MPDWTTMRSLATGDLVTEADMEALRGNIEYLLDPSHQRILRTAASSYLTTSTTFVDVDSTNLSLSLTTHGGPVLVIFSGCVYGSVTSVRAYLDVAIDGTRHAGTPLGLLQFGGLGTAPADGRPAAFSLLVNGLEAGTHTFVLQWAASSSGTIYLLAQTFYNPIQFAAIEL